LSTSALHSPPSFVHTRAANQLGRFKGYLALANHPHTQKEILLVANQREAIYIYILLGARRDHHPSIKKRGHHPAKSDGKRTVIDEDDYRTDLN
jgi:hypothetical protein